VEIDPQDGQYRIVGRADDRITLSNARKVHPAPIERRISQLPGVLHSLLVPSGRHLELWLDVQPTMRESTDWAEHVDALLIDLPAWQRPRRVLVLPRPLSDTPGALTAKGTLVRKVVLAAFNDLANLGDHGRVGLDR
jgi:long-chain acyl-CoA synthetase